MVTWLNEKRRDKEIVELYHQRVTEEALDPLFI